MTKTIDATAIDRFSREVRFALKDLGAAEVSELTDGLEADLAAQAAEQGTSFSLADPEAYAAELRDAAGLPESGRGVLASVDRVVSSVRDFVEGSRALRATWSFLVSLAPVWWLVRAFVAYALVQMVVFRDSWPFLPRNPFGWVALAAFVVGSVQLGRRAWRLNRFWTITVGALNVFAVIITPPIAVTMGNIASQSLELYLNGAQLPVNESGLRFNSEQVDNILVFDADGNPLHDVQLFTQNGDPLSVQFNGNEFPSVVIQDEYLNAQYVENSRAPYGSGWTVFPLRIESHFDDGTSKVTDAPNPIGIVPGLFPEATPTK